MPTDDDGRIYEDGKNGAKVFKNPYGSPGSDKKTYSISDVRANDSLITDEKFEEIFRRLNDEWTRIRDKTYDVDEKNLPAPPTGSGSTQKIATQRYVSDGTTGALALNFPRAGLPTSRQYGYPTSKTWGDIYTSYPSDIKTETGFKIDNDHFNILVAFADNFGISNPGTKGFGFRIWASDINDFIDGIVDAGNQCICNANYCACNCNYCTCNCNYACTCDCDYSDVRLKENIEFLYEKNNLKFYSYNYIWDKKIKKIGVLAQEILKTKFSYAVCTDENGFYMVDYSKLPI